MLKVGLTGNIGSGKSLIARIFSILNIPVYHADEESKKFLEEPLVISEIKRIFGSEILISENKIDRKALAGIVFSNPAALNQLNSILHPRVMEDFSKWCRNYITSPYVIEEAAIIIEAGYQSLFDKIIHVSCPLEISISRVVTRDGVTRNEVLRRMNFQMADHEKAAISDFIILNDGSELVIPQVLRIHKHLLQCSAQSDDDISSG